MSVDSAQEDGVGVVGEGLGCNHGDEEPRLPTLPRSRFKVWDVGVANQANSVMSVLPSAESVEVLVDVYCRYSRWFGLWWADVGCGLVHSHDSLDG